MAGPNLEVLRFGFYIFFPVAMMLKFGDPEWYNDYVAPYGRILFPDIEKTNKPPHTSSEIHDELARLKTERLQAKRSGSIISSPSTLPTTTTITTTTTTPSILSSAPISTKLPPSTITPQDSSLATVGGFGEKVKMEERRTPVREERLV